MGNLLVPHRQWETSYHIGSGKPRTTQAVGNLPVPHRQLETYSYHTGSWKPIRTTQAMGNLVPPRHGSTHGDRRPKGSNHSACTLVTPVAEDFSHGKCRPVSDGVGQCRAVSDSVRQLRTVSGNFGQCWKISDSVGQFRTVSGNFGRCREISDSVGQFRAVSGSQRWSRLGERGRHVFPTREKQTTRPVATVLV